MMKTWQQILAFWQLDIEPSELDCQLMHLQSDARMIEKGDVFVAIESHSGHRNQFIVQALQNGCRAIVTSQPLTAEQIQWVDDICANTGAVCPVAVIENLVEKLGDFADWYYNSPSKKLKVVGITGSNGKTSTAMFTAQLLEALQQKVAVIGTLGQGALNNLKSTGNTTPDVLRLHRYLADFVALGLQWCVMEVSSHAIVEQRIAGVRFHVAALTQVTSDHLDFHGTIENYRLAKEQFFTDFPSDFKVLNGNDAVGQSVLSALPHAFSYGVSISSASECRLQCQVSAQASGLSLEISEGDASQLVSVPVYGLFNAENLMCALSVLHVAGFAWSRVASLLFGLNSVAGRMEQVHQAPTVLIDFAHTEDALAQVLHSVKVHILEAGRLIVVFGCGGDRDQFKRPKMGAVAEKLADIVYVTSDNPRSESPIDIIAQILAGAAHPDTLRVIEDRTAAIEAALSSAESADVVVIAGKGHENYQEICGVKIPYSDYEVVKAFYQKHLKDAK